MASEHKQGYDAVVALKQTGVLCHYEWVVQRLLLVPRTAPVLPLRPALRPLHPV